SHLAAAFSRHLRMKLRTSRVDAKPALRWRDSRITSYLEERPGSFRSSSSSLSPAGNCQFRADQFRREVRSCRQTIGFWLRRVRGVPHWPARRREREHWKVAQPYSTFNAFGCKQRPAWPLRTLCEVQAEGRCFDASQ